MRRSCSLPEAPERKHYWSYGKKTPAGHGEVFHELRERNKLDTYGPALYQRKRNRCSVGSGGHWEELLAARRRWFWWGARWQLAVRKRRGENGGDFKFESTGAGGQLKC